MTKLVVYFDGRPLRDLPRLAWEKVRQQTLRPSDVTRSIPGAWRAVAAGGGGRRRGAFASSGTVQGTAFGMAKIWNSEIWPLLANWRMHFLAVATDQPKFHCIT